MARIDRAAPAFALLLACCALGCTPLPQQTAAVTSAPGKPHSTCRYYSGSRTCREPYEVPQSISCDAFQRSIDQGTANDPGAQSCYGLRQSVDASPDASIPSATRR